MNRSWFVLAVLAKIGELLFVFLALANFLSGDVGKATYLMATAIYMLGLFVWADNRSRGA